MNWTKLFIEGFVIVLLTAFIISYCTTNSPELFFESGCDKSFSINSDSQTFNIKIMNRGEAIAYSSVTFTSEDLTFGKSNLSKYNSKELRYPTVSSDLLYSFDDSISLIDYENPPQNLTIEIYASCKHKIWGFFPKKCKVLNQSCEYYRDNSWYQLIN